MSISDIFSFISVFYAWMIRPNFYCIAMTDTSGKIIDISEALPKLNYPTGKLCIKLDKSADHTVKLPESANLLEECPPSMKKFKSCRTLTKELILHELDVIKAIAFVGNMTIASNLSKD